MGAHGSYEQDEGGGWRDLALSPPVAALAAALLFLGAAVYMLARGPSPTELENDVWTAWINLAADDQDRTFADHLFYRQRGPAEAMLATLGKLTEKNGKRFVLPTQIRYAGLLIPGEEKPFAEWRGQSLDEEYRFDPRKLVDDDWTDREYPVRHPHTGAVLGKLQVSYQFYYNASTGLAVLPGVRQLKTQDFWLLSLVAVLGLVGMFAAVVNLARMRERAGRIAHQQATIDLARQMCHELRNGLWAFSLEGKNLKHFFDASARYLDAEPEAFQAAASKAGLEPPVVERIRRGWTRTLANAHADPATDVAPARALAAEAHEHIESFAKFLQLTVEELDRHLLGSAANREPERLSAAALWEEARELVELRIRAANVEVEVDGPGDVEVTADRRDLTHVFVNLIKNAVEAMHADPPPRRIRFGARAEGDRAVIRIGNTGRPVPPEVLANFFRRGFTTKGASGRGQGLSLIKNLVELAGGAISVHARDEGGVEFTISLPHSSDVPTASND
jgi:signal transduction histidine kinase